MYAVGNILPIGMRTVSSHRETSSSTHRTRAVDSIITKCEIDTPMSSHEPLFFTQNRKCAHMMSHIKRITMNSVSGFNWIFGGKKLGITGYVKSYHLCFTCLAMLMDADAQMTNRTGMNSFIIISAAIRNGEKVSTKQRTQFGSNELIEARFPVPKNEIST